MVNDEYMLRGSAAIRSITKRLFDFFQLSTNFVILTKHHRAEKAGSCKDGK